MKLANEITKLREQFKQDTFLTHFFKELNYSYFYNFVQKDILVLGLNPTKYKAITTSKIKPYQFEDLLNSVTQESYLYFDYFKRIDKILNSQSNEIKLLQGTAYTNFFYYQTNTPVQDLNFLFKNNNSFPFLNQQIKLTHRLLNDVIQPKVIILTYHELLLFFDKKNKFIKDLETFNYDLNFLKKTKSGCKIYELKTSNTHDVNNKLQNVRIILAPYLHSNEQNFEIKLKSEEILKELYSVLQIKNLVSNNEYIDLDGPLWIEAPSLYNLAKTVRLKAVDESLILNLKIWKHLNFKDFIEQVIADLHQKNLLDIQDYQNLLSPTYSEKEFKSKVPIFKKKEEQITLNKQTNRNLMVNNEVLKMHDVRNRIQKWYINKIFKKK